MVSATPVDFDAIPRVPYWTQIRGPLFEVLATIENIIERERRAELEARAFGMRMWLVTHVRVARQTYAVIEALAFERKAVSLGLEISVAVPPLARVILESAFSLTYVFDAPGTRLPEFWKNAWRKIAEQCEEYTTAYGNDPNWAQWLQLLIGQRDGWRDDLVRQGTPLSPQQIADWRLAPRWPNPGRMPNACVDQWRRDTLAYLNVRYYGSLSIAAHLSGTGLLAQGGAVLPDQHADTQRKYFSDQLMTALAMLFALVSQYAIDVIPEPAFARRIIALWNASNLPASVGELFNRCYREKLEALAIR